MITLSPTILLLGLVLIGCLVAMNLPAFSSDDAPYRRRLHEIKSVRYEFAKDGPKRRYVAPPLRSLAMVAVNSLDLRKHLGSGDHKERLIQAGFRAPTSETMYLFARFAAPVILAVLAVINLFGFNTFELDLPMQIGGVLGATYFGLKLPDIYVKNALLKRQDEIRKAWPDCLDLMLICVEAGMTIEMTFRKVAQEIDLQSKALAEELTYTLAELSHLSDRAQAYSNLGDRTGLEDVKNVAVTLTQAERVGTPIGTALRILAQDSRDRRMTAAEKKAAALGPKLTVPMIAFFLPVLLFLLVWPGAIEAMGWK